MPRIVPLVTNNHPITITKLEAARRQVLQAIRLFFDGGDCVCIHTLAAAAHGILNDIATANGTFTIESLIRPDKLRFYCQTVRKDQNFFKHADKDPQAALVFSPARTHFVLFEAAFLMGSLLAKTDSAPVRSPFAWSRESMVFMWWFGAKYPETVSWNDEQMTQILSIASPDDLELFRNVLAPRLKGAEKGP